MKTVTELDVEEKKEIEIQLGIEPSSSKLRLDAELLELTVAFNPGDTQVDLYGY
jgi:hypothetical protein